jgi:serine/threonine protein kinase
MGEVYKALDTRLGRTVAIKTLRSAHGERFQQEARALSTSILRDYSQPVFRPIVASDSRPSRRSKFERMRRRD